MALLGTIGVTGLDIRCVLGVHPEERNREQTVKFDLKLSYDFERAARTDDIRHSLDYDRVVRLVTEHATYHKYRLLEALVAGIVEMLQNAYPFVVSGVVRARKPEALGDQCDESWAELKWGGGD